MVVKFNSHHPSEFHLKLPTCFAARVNAEVPAVQVLPVTLVATVLPEVLVSPALPVATAKRCAASPAAKTPAKMPNPATLVRTDPTVHPVVPVPMATEAIPARPVLKDLPVPLVPTEVPVVPAATVFPAKRVKFQVVQVTKDLAVHPVVQGNPVPQEVPDRMANPEPLVLLEMMVVMDHPVVPARPDHPVNPVRWAILAAVTIALPPVWLLAIKH